MYAKLIFVLLLLSGCGDCADLGVAEPSKLTVQVKPIFEPAPGATPSQLITTPNRLQIVTK